MEQDNYSILDPSSLDISELISQREARSPFDSTTWGTALSQRLESPEKWANNLVLCFEQAQNPSAKANFATIISNWLKFFAERQPPPLKASDLTNAQLTQALSRLEYLKHGLSQNRQSDTFGVG